jgi:hypothetical protein
MIRAAAFAIVSLLAAPVVAQSDGSEVDHAVTAHKVVGAFGPLVLQNRPQPGMPRVWAPRLAPPAPVVVTPPSPVTVIIAPPPSINAEPEGAVPYVQVPLRPIYSVRHAPRHYSPSVSPSYGGTPTSRPATGGWRGF